MRSLRRTCSWCTVQCERRVNCSLRSDGPGSAAVHSQHTRGCGSAPSSERTERRQDSRDKTCRSYGTVVLQWTKRRRRRAGSTRRGALLAETLRRDVLLAIKDGTAGCPAPAAVVSPRSPPQIHTQHTHAAAAPKAHAPWPRLVRRFDEGAALVGSVAHTCGHMADETALLHSEPEPGKDARGSLPPTADTRHHQSLSAHAPCAKRVGWAVQLRPRLSLSAREAAVHEHTRTDHTLHSRRHSTQQSPPASKHRPTPRRVRCGCAAVYSAVHNPSEDRWSRSVETASPCG